MPRSVTIREREYDYSSPDYGKSYRTTVDIDHEKDIRCSL